MICQGKKAIACWRMWMCVYNNRCAVAREAATAPFHLKSVEKVIPDDSIFLEIPEFFFFFPDITTRKKKPNKPKISPHSFSFLFYVRESWQLLWNKEVGTDRLIKSDSQHKEEVEHKKKLKNWKYILKSFRKICFNLDYRFFFYSSSTHDARPCDVSQIIIDM